MRIRHVIQMASMASLRTIRLAVGSFLLLAFLASYGTAQQRTFVSGLGSDANPCTRAAPCRTFSVAVGQTSAGGEVVALDSAGYGAFNINKSISIIAPPGVYAGISVSSADGIDVEAGASDTVVLRGLTVINQGSTGSGIVAFTVGTLHVESCVVSGFFHFAGLSFESAGTLEVKDSIFRGNATGILVETPGPAVAVVDQVRLEGIGGTSIGLSAETISKVTVSNSLASNCGFGFGVAGGAGGFSAELNLENCVASNNGHGVDAELGGVGGTAVLRLSDCTITDNNIGVSNSFATVLSRGNNTIEGNGTDTSGTIGSYTAK